MLESQVNLRSLIILNKHDWGLLCKQPLSSLVRRFMCYVNSIIQEDSVNLPEIWVIVSRWNSKHLLVVRLANAKYQQQRNKLQFRASQQESPTLRFSWIPFYSFFKCLLVYSLLIWTFPSLVEIWANGDGKPIFIIPVNHSENNSLSQNMTSPSFCWNYTSTSFILLLLLKTTEICGRNWVGLTGGYNYFLMRLEVGWKGNDRISSVIIHKSDFKGYVS